jgi:plasmid replication initiation protein
VREAGHENQRLGCCCFLLFGKIQEEYIMPEESVTLEEKDKEVNSLGINDNSLGVATSLFPEDDFALLPNPEDFLGKDEMNLAEFPFAVLSKHASDNQKTIEIIQEGEDAQRRPIRQEWIVTGSDAFGLPTASDDEVYVALMKLLRDTGFRERTVRFYIADLLDIMQSSRGKRDYERIAESLDRLTGVTIRAKNAFWDNQQKRHVTEAFHILESYRLTSGSGRRVLSEVTFSEFLFASIQSGNIKNLDIGLYFRLESPLAKRLFRLLDKHHNRGKWRHYEIEIMRLAHKLPLQDAYVSQVRRRLEPAFANLIAEGVLSAVTYRTNAKGDTILRVEFAEKTEKGKEIAEEKAKLDSEKKVDSEKPEVIPTILLPTQTPDLISENDSEESSELPLLPSLQERLQNAGVSRHIASQLLKEHPEEEVERQLAYLPFQGEIRNRGAFLRKAVEEGYGPPPAYERQQEELAKIAERGQQAEREKASNSTLEAQRAVLDAETDTELIRLEKDAPETFSAFLAFVEKQKKLQRKPGMTEAILRRLNDAFESPATRRKLYREWLQQNDS